MIDDLRRLSGIRPPDKDKLRRKRKEKRSETAFSDILEASEQHEDELELEGLLSDVDLSDRLLREHPNPDNLDHYKDSVKRFLEKLLNKRLKVTRTTGRAGNRPKIYTMIEQVDSALDQLEKDMHSSLQFDIASRLDEIRGILIDLYT